MGLSVLRKEERLTLLGKILSLERGACHPEEERKTWPDSHISRISFVRRGEAARKSCRLGEMVGGSEGNQGRGSLGGGGGVLLASEVFSLRVSSKGIRRGDESCKSGELKYFQVFALPNRENSLSFR